MSNTVGVNGLSIVHVGSGGSLLALPNVNLTPQPAGPPVPMPYVSAARSSDATAVSPSVKCGGNGICITSSSFSKSSGDPPTSKGVISGTAQGRATFINGSFDVTVEGESVVRALDLMSSNNSNTPPSPLIQMPVVVLEPPLPGQRECAVCGETF
jgi:hypothetical protein